MYLHSLGNEVLFVFCHDIVRGAFARMKIVGHEFKRQRRIFYALYRKFKKLGVPGTRIVSYMARKFACVRRRDAYPAFVHGSLKFA